MLYNNFEERKNTGKLSLRKACKTAIRLLRLKTIRRLQRLKETSSTVRKEFVDKLEVLRRLKVDTILRAIEDRHFDSKGFLGNIQAENVCWEIVQDKRVQEVLRKVPKEEQKEGRISRSSYKASKTQRDWKKVVEKPLINSMFLDSLNGETTFASGKKKHTSTKGFPKDTSFFESNDLHPSWRAKRWRRKWESSICFQGCHKYF
ncbi:hypothetical protein Gasu_24510 isoform 1 [Galdieria sulphuraria]|uniref:Uncharacterized protein n=1 Tax=Galdieria sulphuraria TaxID=130081 RepID=M2W3L9_GALSU|nr:hypothetical protein Gasu_24510 isoform 1 [Galdieria sulphuraria]EME30306.1 hypothetical protein isoform 1 [Galdieria sulphuraria]|eukprot:XP_005706826.1 hypothetical protein isoform 1 [Galdieria sulphuraria]